MNLSVVSSVQCCIVMPGIPALPCIFISQSPALRAGNSMGSAMAGIAHNIAVALKTETFNSET